MPSRYSTKNLYPTVHIFSPNALWFLFSELLSSHLSKVQPCPCTPNGQLNFLYFQGAPGIPIQPDTISNPTLNMCCVTAIAQNRAGERSVLGQVEGETLSGFTEKHVMSALRYCIAGISNRPKDSDRLDFDRFIWR